LASTILVDPSSWTTFEEHQILQRITTKHLATANAPLTAEKIGFWEMLMLIAGTVFVVEH
jgi:hypothetical protein